jgi:hypothetical protein
MDGARERSAKEKQRAWHEVQLAPHRGFDRLGRVRSEQFVHTGLVEQAPGNKEIDMSGRRLFPLDPGRQNDPQNRNRTSPSR